MSKTNILKTFEIFNREALSVLRERVFTFLLFETQHQYQGSSCIYTDLKNQKNVQISIVNNKKVYNLLSSTWERHKKKYENIKS